MDARFFDESSEQSRIKSRIISKYFWAWAKVIIPSVRGRGDRIAYIDLFAGPGRYKDGTISTPVLVLQRAINEPEMRKMIVTVFNDRDIENVRSLQAVIEGLPGIVEMRYKPQIFNREIGTEIVSLFEKMRPIPTFFFVDPWGYKGLSLDLINSVLRNWGCDCVFFFNYNRINMGLPNEGVRDHMNALFGEKRADAIRQKLGTLNPGERETLIIEELSRALKQLGAKYVLPFTFRNERGTKTTHHLIFASKHFKGYEIMKEIMAGESSERDQGVPSFSYSPASQKYPTLFELSRPLDDLEGMLLKEFDGQRVRMADIYERHNVDRPYTKSNYKHALTKMENEGKIEADPPAAKRPKRKGEPTFADDVLVHFLGKVHG